MAPRSATEFLMAAESRLSLLPPGSDLAVRAEEPRGPLSFSYDGLRRFCTFLLVLVTFLGLFLTGELSPIVAVIFVLAWVLGYIFDRAPRWWRPWMENPLTVIVLVLISLVIRVSFFNAVLYLLLFLVLSKCYTMRSARDHLQVQLLCFFIILSTSVMTIAFYFALVFPLYLLLATICLGLHGIGSQRERVLRTSLARGRSAPLSNPGALPGRFLAASAVGAVLLIGLIAFYFAFIPHISTQQLDSPLSGRRVPRPERISGFSEEVTLGSFKQLTPDPTIVLRVELTWPRGAAKERPQALRLRGAALDKYEVSRWRRTSSDAEAITTTERQQLDLKVQSAQRGPVTYQKVYQNPDITSRIFAASMPIAADLQRNLRVRMDQATRTAQVTNFGGTAESSFTNPFVYTVTSGAVEEATPLLMKFIEYRKELNALGALVLKGINDPEEQKALRRRIRREGAQSASSSRAWLTPGLGYTLDPRSRLINTDLPESAFMQRLGELARTAAPGPTDADIIVQLTEYLRNNFTYSLQPETPPNTDPIDAFLFKTKKGHCEYFATALVLMLRSRGIPARLINGFYASEWNELAELYVVKQSDAHAWVEAWHDDLGWLTLDPTPPGSVGRGAYGIESYWAGTNFTEFIRVQWQRLVIDYSDTKQSALLGAIRQRAGSSILGSRLVRALQGGDASPSSAAPQADDENRTGSAPFLLFAALALLVSLWPALRFWRRRTRLIESRYSNIDYLSALLKRLERLGLRRVPAQTPLEFIRSASSSLGRGEELEWLVALYYRHRFSGVPPATSDRDRALAIIRSLGRAA